MYPSSLFVSNSEVVVDTILGSCVAVCLFDSKIKAGGINHYMLPYWNGEGLASPKYGNIANEKLIEKLYKLGATKNSLVAKVFGGANQINSTINVGDRNVLVAREQLETFGIRIISESIGGGVGRKIRFNTHTNEVLLKFLSKKEEK
ncbi:MAG: chemotaxis protein CheD [Bacteroidota bacterium]